MVNGLNEMRTNFRELCVPLSSSGEIKTSVQDMNQLCKTKTSCARQKPINMHGLELELFNTPWMTRMPALLSPLPPAEGDGPGNDGQISLVEITTKRAVVPPPARVWPLVVHPLSYGVGQQTARYRAL